MDPAVPLNSKKIPLLLKIFGVLTIIVGFATLPSLGLSVFSMVILFQQGQLGEDSAMTNIIYITMLSLLAIIAVTLIVFGIRMVRNNRRGVRLASELLVVLVIGVLMCNIMLYGISSQNIVYGIILVFLIALSSYIDPSLAEERELQRKLRKMEERDEALLGDKAGRDPSGKGYITLNFFNLFWIFVIASIIGLIIETLYYVIVVNPGHYQDRAGLLYGPFSPIYGVGAVLMTVALNRVHDRSIILIFLMSALIGGAFEYFVSWFLQFSFGIVAWDYTGTFLSIDGRTNGQFMAMWGILGVFWIKFCLPAMLRLVNLIPWNWRYSVTSVCAALMLVNCVMTLMAYDCWYEREAGREPETAVEVFFAQRYDNTYMENRFQTMSINPDDAIRVS